jgi:hypothetical protein
VQGEVTLNALLSREEYADVCFAFGFGVVTRLLLLKYIGNDFLGHESPTEVCSHVFTDACE